MKDYIIVNLLGADNKITTVILETNDNFKIKEIVEKNGYGDFKILPDWKMIKAKIIN